MSEESTDPDGSSAPPHAHAIDVTDGKALAAIGNPERCGVFEVLRCFRRPATLAELALATRVSRARLVAIVDRLVEAGLVRARPARGARRSPAFEVTCQQVLIVYDRDNPAECEAVRRHQEAATADLARAIRDARTRGVAGTQHAVAYDSRGKFALRPDQFMELRRRLHAVDEFINQIAEDAMAPDPAAPLLCNHLIDMRVMPLPKPLLPFPWILAADRRQAARLADASERSIGTQLTAREREVAMALSHGESRPAAARRLGISVNTVASIAKHVYAKLGVRNRAELANRMGALSRM